MYQSIGKRRNDDDDEDEENEINLLYFDITFEWKIVSIVECKLIFFHSSFLLLI